MRLINGNRIRKATWEGVLDYVSQNVPDKYIASMLSLTVKQFRRELRENLQFRVEIDKARTSSYLETYSDWNSLKHIAEPHTKAKMLEWEMEKMHGVNGKQNFSAYDEEDEKAEIGGKFILEVASNGKNK